MQSEDCDHKGKGLAVMSWGACCECCGEPYPYEIPAEPSNAAQALMIGSYVNDAAHNLLVKHTGSEGGCPTVNWYKLRDEIALAIEAGIDAFSSQPAPSVAVKALTAEDILAGIKDQRFGYVVQDGKLTVGTDRRIGIDLKELAEFLSRSALSAQVQEMAPAHPSW